MDKFFLVLCGMFAAIAVLLYARGEKDWLVFTAVFSIACFFLSYRFRASERLKAHREARESEE